MTSKQSPRWGEDHYRNRKLGYLDEDDLPPVAVMQLYSAMRSGAI